MRYMCLEKERNGNEMNYMIRPIMQKKEKATDKVKREKMSIFAQNLSHSKSNEKIQITIFLMHHGHIYRHCCKSRGFQPHRG